MLKDVDSCTIMQLESKRCHLIIWKHYTQSTHQFSQGIVQYLTLTLDVVGKIINQSLCTWTILKVLGGVPT